MKVFNEKMSKTNPCLLKLAIHDQIKSYIPILPLPVKYFGSQQQFDFDRAQKS